MVKNFFQKDAVKVAIFVIIMVLAWFTYINRIKTQVTNLDLKVISISINDIIVNAEVVDTEPLIEKGLGGRSSLGEQKGMWFVFSNDEKFGFWMKDMKFPIDIIWFDKNLKIVGMEEDVSPESYPNIFYPGKESRYVLEVDAGFSKKHKIKIDDQAKIVVAEALKD